MAIRGSNNPFPSVLLVEQASAPTSPAASRQRLYINSTTHHANRVDASGNVVDIEALGQVLAADPASPVDGQFWITDDGGTPASIALKFRKGGVTYTLAEVTV